MALVRLSEGGQTEQAATSENSGPVSYTHLTALISDVLFGKTLADRLQQLDCCGFIVSKLETYDARYFTGVYEWATATGGRAILIRTPHLVVSFSPRTRQDLTATCLLYTSRCV